MIREYLVPDPLNLIGDVSKNWEGFKKKFDAFMRDAELNSKPEETKLAIFFNLIGKDAFEVFKTFKFDYQSEDGTISSSMTLKNVMDRFKKYCDKKNKVIYNVYKFYERKQLPGENFDSYLKAIVHIGKFCDFEVTDRMLRDRIISGVKNSKLREELMLLPDATFNNVIKYCKDFERRNEADEVLNEEKIYLFSYKIMKCKELKDRMSHIKSYITVDVEDLQNTNEKQVIKQDVLKKEKYDAMLHHSVKNEQCVPSNSSDEENNISSLSVKAEKLGELSSFQNVSMEIDTKLGDSLKVNPMSKLAVKDVIQDEKFKVRWEDIFADCHNSDENLQSTESDTEEDFGEISFMNKCFTSKQDDNILTTKQESDKNDKPTEVIYTEILKDRLRKRKINSFKCQYCKKVFPRKFELLSHEKICRHVKTEKLEKESRKLNPKYEVKKEKKDCKHLYSCKECGKVCTAEHYLKMHYITHTKEKPFICEVCNRSFAYIAHYKNHLRVHKTKSYLH